MGGKKALAYYQDGRCYYSIPVRHFNDDEVKLYVDPSATGTKEYFWKADEGVNKVNQEGRYGIVRNHWYSVNVNSIALIGRPAPVDPTTPINPDPSYPDPTDPTVNDEIPTTDDVENLYLNAQINILPWAKRSQNADL